MVLAAHNAGLKCRSSGAKSTAIPSKCHLIQKSFKTLAEQPDSDMIADSWMTAVVSVSQVGGGGRDAGGGGVGGN